MGDIINRITNLPEGKRALLIQKLAQSTTGHHPGLPNNLASRESLIMPSHPCYLDLEIPGNFQSFRFLGLAEMQPGPTQVIIGTKAVSLNFRDLMIAMNMYPSTPGIPSVMGSDIAGTVLACGSEVERFAPGDDVIALSAGNLSSNGAMQRDSHFASHCVAVEDQVLHKPKNLDFAEAACIPTVFLTSYFSIVHTAQLQPGERILIHSATGGVGLSAVQIAQWIGAEIYATAGSAEKREYLEKTGVDFVMDSRSSCSDDVMRYSRKEGIDVILNMSSGGPPEAGLELLRPFGRLIELSKRSTLEVETLPLRYFRNGLSYTTVDIALFVSRAHMLQELLTAICGHIGTGVFGKLPYLCFPVEKVGEALTYMSRRKHIGKIVLSYEKA
jgi:phthiocerol/phenolphthiocerol synthesis type-I polyketide synthase C